MPVPLFIADESCVTRSFSSSSAPFSASAYLNLLSPSYGLNSETRAFVAFTSTSFLIFSALLLIESSVQVATTVYVFAVLPELSLLSSSFLSCVRTLSVLYVYFKSFYVIVYVFSFAFTEIETGVINDSCFEVKSLSASS
mgnify:CR=1 FL=1